MRVKRLLISSELFCHLFTLGTHHGYRVIEQAIPADAHVRNVRLGWPAQLEILVESQDFDDVREGEEIPTLVPRLLNGVQSDSLDS